MRLPALLLLAAVVPTVLSGCRYNFVPLIPPEIEVELPARVTRAILLRTGEVLVLQARLEGRFEPGFLRVSWFDGSRALGTDNVYLDASGREATFTLTAPGRGAYRALLSFGETLLRQVELYEVQP